MIKKLIEDFQRKKVEKIINKPKFAIASLKVGEIVSIYDRKYHTNDRVTHYYKVINQHAVLIDEGYGLYKHLKSQEALRELFWTDVVDYAVTNLRSFNRSKAMAYLKTKGYSKNSKLSIKQILQLEDALKTGLLDDITPDEVFK